MPDEAQTIKKEWSKHPIPVNKRFRPVLCGSTLLDYRARAESFEELINTLAPTPENPLLSIGRYETRAKPNNGTGLYFEKNMPKLDENDADVSRNLAAIWLLC